MILISASTWGSFNSLDKIIADNQSSFDMSTYKYTWKGLWASTKLLSPSSNLLWIRWVFRGRNLPLATWVVLRLLKLSLAVMVSHSCQYKPRNDLTYLFICFSMFDCWEEAYQLWEAQCSFDDLPSRTDFASVPRTSTRVSMFTLIASPAVFLVVESTSSSCWSSKDFMWDRDSIDAEDLGWNHNVLWSLRRMKLSKAAVREEAKSVTKSVHQVSTRTWCYSC